MSACPAINWHGFLPAELRPPMVRLATTGIVPQAKLDAAQAPAAAPCIEVDEVIVDPTGALA